MVLKKVVYTGETNEVLRSGEIYDVIAVKKRENKVIYTIDGINEQYFSNFFEEVCEGNPLVYVAITADTNPIYVGDRLRAFYRFEEGVMRKVPQSSEIKEVKSMPNNVYEVHTQNVVYYIQQAKPQRRKKATK